MFYIMSTKCIIINVVSIKCAVGTDLKTLQCVLFNKHQGTFDTNHGITGSCPLLRVRETSNPTSEINIANGNMIYSALRVGMPYAGCQSNRIWHSKLLRLGTWENVSEAMSETAPPQD